jgi:hypothetical protein
MKLTEAQQAQRQAIALAKARLYDAHKVYGALLRECKCVAVKGVFGGAHCAICKNDMGWWCPKSKNHRCSYTMNYSDCCKFCGEPSERK